MLVIVGLSKLEDGTIQIRVGKPQHYVNFVRSYTEEEAREVLLEWGIEDEMVNEHLSRILPALSAKQESKLAPMDIPLHQLSTCGFKFEANTQRIDK